MQETVNLSLDANEALVFFDWLAALEGNRAGPPEDSAEQKVLWKLEAQLEKALAEPLSPNYKRLLDDARRKVLSAT